MDDALAVEHADPLPVVHEGQWLGMLDRERIVHYMRARAELGV